MKPAMKPRAAPALAKCSRLAYRGGRDAVPSGGQSGLRSAERGSRAAPPSRALCLRIA
jgi:hypothetical protein